MEMEREGERETRSNRQMIEISLDIPTDRGHNKGTQAPHN